jgi:hypothetical protein
MGGEGCVRKGEGGREARGRAVWRERRLSKGSQAHKRRRVGCQERVGTEIESKGGQELNAMEERSYQTIIPTSPPPSRFESQTNASVVSHKHRSAA